MILASNGYIIVNQNEYIIIQDNWTKEIQPELFETGRYWVGYGKQAIIFPRSIQRLVFDTIAGSDDLPITIDTPVSAQLDAFFQYQLNKSHIMSIYTNYQTFAAFKDALLYRIWAIVAESMTGVNYQELYFNRSIVNNLINTKLREQLAPIGVVVLLFQITEVAFPQSIQNAFSTLQNAIIQQQVATEQQRTAMIQAQTAIINTMAQANISRIQAEANAEVMLIQTKAIAEQMNITLNMDVYELKLLMNATYVNGTGETAKIFQTSQDLLVYLWIQALTQVDTLYLILGEATLLLNIQPSNSTITN